MARVKTNPILLISTLDPTCQSGLVRDAIVLHQLGKTTLAVCTAVANQNDVEIDDLTVLSFEEIKRQLDAIGRKYWLDWAVISGVHDLNLIAAIIRYLEQKRPGIQLLWHPALRHTDRTYLELLNNQEQALFETLCKKVHTVFLDQRDLLLFPNDKPVENFISKLSENNCLYLTGDEQHPDVLYRKRKQIKQSISLTAEHQLTFLSTLVSFLYDGNEISQACSQASLFLSTNSIN
ncbi:MAG: hydroxymethylpyrimidine/phosphomethylpyrimidine kinase [Cytophagaceae bacterium]|jgi:hydroxymethylpyrimidine/phosphomethylpyrimidine kinase|nr:hydroxymethylpyrimidine/phosphomethylpyrimidine kinase [Cytophagaceae bacterium]